MRLNTISVLASLVGFTLAQTPDLAGLPTCAQTPALQGASSSGCSLTDAECFCKNTVFIDSLKAAISGSCTSASDQQAACSWGNAACAAYGVTIPCDTSATQTMSDPGSVVAGSSSISPTSATVDPAMTSATDVNGSIMPTSSVSNPAEGGMTSMAGGSMMSSISSTMMATMSMMNSTHTNGNMTYAPTAMATSTTSGQTSRYTGAGNTAARKTGMIEAVSVVALLLAVF